MTPRESLSPDPQPVPVLRVRGTGHTEMELYPAVKQLRQAILATYEQDGYGEMRRKDLDTKVWQVTTPPDGRELITEKPYVGLQRGSRTRVAVAAMPPEESPAVLPHLQHRMVVNIIPAGWGVACP